MQNIIAVPNWSDKTILIVEDEEINRFFFKMALRVTNVNLLFANNGFEGIEMALNNDKIDCVLMDIMMPIVDGYEAIMKIKEVRKTLPIIAQSAYSLSQERKRAFDSGCDDFISKPIDIGILFSLLEKYLVN
jgi:two-component system cell cycle response regulator DivK